jgi:hypothetical protein
MWKCSCADFTLGKTIEIVLWRLTWYLPCLVIFSFLQVKLTNPADMDLLMDEAAYAKHLESEADH